MLYVGMSGSESSVEVWLTASSCRYLCTAVAQPLGDSVASHRFYCSNISRTVHLASHSRHSSQDVFGNSIWLFVICDVIVFSNWYIYVLCTLLLMLCSSIYFNPTLSYFLYCILCLVSGCTWLSPGISLLHGSYTFFILILIFLYFISFLIHIWDIKFYLILNYKKTKWMKFFKSCWLSFLSLSFSYYCYYFSWKFYILYFQNEK